jgi:hypothetical protein
MVVVGALTYWVYQNAPKIEHMATRSSAKWSTWSWQYAVCQTLAVLGTLVYPAIRLSWGAGLDFALYPFYGEIAAISAAFILSTLLLPLGYAMVIQRTIVRPFSEVRVPPQRTFSMALKVGVVLVGTILVIACEIARLSGVHFFFIYLPIFVAFLISSVISVRVAQTRLVNETQSHVPMIPKGGVLGQS